MSEHARSKRSGWDDAPLRAKATAVAALGTMLGLATGLVEVKLGGQLYPLLAGLSITFGIVLWLSSRWIARPVETLAGQLDAMAQTSKPQDIKTLPADRSDEVGRIARAVWTIAAGAVRNHHEARSLRQTMDSRVLAQTAIATRQLKLLAMRDALTDMGNRRFLSENLDTLVKVSRDSGVDLVCVLIDVDKFKEVNDVLGHQAGDDLLVLMAELIKASVRHGDLTVRLGGDEFAVIMPGADIDRVTHLTEQLRQLLRQQVKVMYPHGPHANLSIGLGSLFVDACESGEELLAAADRRLYTAKHRGRGCTVDLNDRTVGAAA